MEKAVATSVTEPREPLDVHHLHVAGVPEATELLKRERFVFVGAPNRWRKEVNGRITRADIRRGQDGRCVVVLFQWQQPQTRCGHARNSVGSLS